MRTITFKIICSLIQTIWVYKIPLLSFVVIFGLPKIVETCAWEMEKMEIIRSVAFAALKNVKRATCMQEEEAKPRSIAVAPSLREEERVREGTSHLSPNETPPPPFYVHFYCPK